jgi:hypothetical protein
LGSCVKLYSLAETPQLPPPPTPSAVGLIYEGAIGQPRETTTVCKPLIMMMYLMPLFSVLERPAGARLPSSSSFLLAASSSLRTSCTRSNEVNEVNEVNEAVAFVSPGLEMSKTKYEIERIAFGRAGSGANSEVLVSFLLDVGKFVERLFLYFFYITFREVKKGTTGNARRGLKMQRFS